MTCIDLRALFRIDRAGSVTKRICRIYSPGWDTNIDGWAEEVAEAFESFCRFHGDDPAACKLVGEAKWVWMRFSKSMAATVKEDEFAGAERVTMFRVHRVRGKGA
jgi:hypothetical protein